MRYGSICSGIEGASVAWEPLGWTPSFFAEIEPFPSTVLADRWPGVINLGDFTTIDELGREVEILIGGTPCQDFSITGLRRGIRGDRGNLTLEFLRLAQRLRPSWLVWENVPGVLSVDRGRAFGAFLGGLGQLGYGWAYRVLDARQFGVPQRRRRVYVVGCFGGSRAAFEVLFDPQVLPGDLESTGQISPRTSRIVPESDGIGSPGRRERDRDRRDYGGLTFGWTGDETPKYALDAVPTIRAAQGGEGIGVVTDNGLVRRLTPVELERCMGFSDGYTDVPFRGKPASDSVRRHALGNSFVVPVIRWIGRRIDLFNARNS